MTPSSIMCASGGSFRRRRSEKDEPRNFEVEGWANYRPDPDRGERAVLSRSRQLRDLIPIDLLAQRDRAPASEAGGPVFESPGDRQHGRQSCAQFSKVAWSMIAYREGRGAYISFGLALLPIASASSGNVNAKSGRCGRSGVPTVPKTVAQETGEGSTPSPSATLTRIKVG
jgi:hypothetical protein